MEHRSLKEIMKDHRRMAHKLSCTLKKDFEEVRVIGLLHDLERFEMEVRLQNKKKSIPTNMEKRSAKFDAYKLQYRHRFTHG